MSSQVGGGGEGCAPPAPSPRSPTFITDIATQWPFHVTKVSLKLQVAEPLLPYALAFAAGAMIYVVVDDIIPEAQTRFDIIVIFTAVFTNHDCKFDFYDLIIHVVILFE